MFLDWCFLKPVDRPQSATRITWAYLRLPCSSISITHRVKWMNLCVVERRNCIKCWYLSNNMMKTSLSKLCFTGLVCSHICIGDLSPEPAASIPLAEDRPGAGNGLWWRWVGGGASWPFECSVMSKKFCLMSLWVNTGHYQNIFHVSRYSDQRYNFSMDVIAWWLLCIT